MEFELRRWKERNIPHLVKHGSHPSIADMMTDPFPSPMTEEASRLLVDSWLNADDSRVLCRAVLIDGEAVGGVSVTLLDGIHCRTGELSFWLTPSLWGNRIATCAVRQICAEAFGLFDIVRIQAQPLARNKAARCVLNNAGFSFDGLLRQSICRNDSVQDGCMYSLLRSDLL